MNRSHQRAEESVALSNILTALLYGWPVTFRTAKMDHGEVQRRYALRSKDDIFVATFLGCEASESRRRGRAEGRLILVRRCRRSLIERAVCMARRSRYKQSVAERLRGAQRMIPPRHAVRPASRARPPATPSRPNESSFDNLATLAVDFHRS